ncbi:MAG: response regulator [Candidatus Omnitrophica bacterium]|nr:response regulator [Candidatus Omnitrophota bacterium]
MDKVKILICDDEEGVRESLRLILEKDYELVFANDGEETINKIKQDNEIKIILMDIKMPKRDGLNMLKQVKRDFPGVSVIMITGYQTAEIAAEAIKLGALDYIVKPIDSKQVLTSIRKLI